MVQQSIRLQYRPLRGPSLLDYAVLSSDELVRTCLASGDNSAWAEFIRRFHPLIATVVLRVCRKWGEGSPQVVDDLVQETYLKLCMGRARLQNFQPAHPDAIYGYLKVFTANLVHDYFKSLHSARSGGASVTVPVDADEGGRPTGAPTPSALVEREVLLREIDAFLRAVATGPHAGRDRKIFWLYYRLGLTAGAIAALPHIGLTIKGVESTILRLTRLVRERACKAAVEPCGKPTKGIETGESF
jgi:RNA polymerase sigma-70 factor (ECF subfamily)